MKSAGFPMCASMMTKISLLFAQQLLEHPMVLCSITHQPCQVTDHFLGWWLLLCYCALLLLSSLNVQLINFFHFSPVQLQQKDLKNHRISLRYGPMQIPMGHELQSCQPLLGQEHSRKKLYQNWGEKSILGTLVLKNVFEITLLRTCTV